VVQERDGLGLVLEPTDLDVAGELGVSDHLDRDRTIERDLPGLVNDAHSSLSKDLDQFIVADVSHALAGRERTIFRRV
jgi:hypothetical protein